MKKSVMKPNPEKNRKKLLPILLFISILSISFITAGVPDPYAMFELDFSEVEIPEGDWQISVINLPQYISWFHSSLNKTEYNDVREHFNILTTKYLEVKEFCGVPDYIKIKIDLSKEELESYKDKKIIISRSRDYTLYYILDGEEYSKCQFPLSHRFIQDSDPVLKDNYRATINFRIYHYQEGVRLGREGSEMSAFYPTSCELNESKCEVHLVQHEMGPYIIVLEKMNSKKEIYFSDPLNINWTKDKEIIWDSWEPETYNFKIQKIEFKEPNKLLISLENSEILETPTKEIKEESSNIILYTALILSLVIIVLLIKWRRKLLNKRK